MIFQDCNASGRADLFAERLGYLHCRMDIVACAETWKHVADVGETSAGACRKRVDEDVYHFFDLAVVCQAWILRSAI